MEIMKKDPADAAGAAPHAQPAASSSTIWHRCRAGLLAWQASYFWCGYQQSFRLQVSGFKNRRLPLKCYDGSLDGGPGHFFFPQGRLLRRRYLKP